MDPTIGFGTIHVGQSSAVKSQPGTGTTEVDTVAGLVVVNAAAGSGRLLAAASAEIV